MQAPVLFQAHRLTAEDFTEEDMAELHLLMSRLLTTCSSLGQRHAPDGEWAPAGSGACDHMAQSMELFADVSRILNKTRAGVRRIGGRARMRMYRRTHGRTTAPVTPGSPGGRAAQD
ncbi:hypothetical protein ACIQPQ_26150 [Streptomyces sp. NPDC091281]|uniref:hypothetical protein n=1 Tax=Streptomyces sp. NPDC091281 TaxID=3365985 RepID=UPI00380E74D0